MVFTCLVAPLALPRKVDIMKAGFGEKELLKCLMSVVSEQRMIIDAVVLHVAIGPNPTEGTIMRRSRTCSIQVLCELLKERVHRLQFEYPISIVSLFLD